MTRVDDEGGNSRLHRNERSGGRDISAEWTEATPALPVPGKATLTSRLPFAAPEAAARNAVRAAVGATQRVVTWVPQLMDAIATASYAEAGRLSFEIRSALRRAHLDLAELERKAPEQATAIADLIDAARVQLHAAERDSAILLRAAPALEDPQAASAEAEAAWTEARTRVNDAGWQQDAATMASALGLGEVTVHSDDAARSLTDAKGARGVALGDAIYLHPSRVRPGTAEGREVLAHELVHLAQARLPRETGAGRAAAEREAAALAPALARGGAARPNHFIDLSHAAADRDADQEIATTAAEPTLPSGADYQVVDGFDAVLANRVWLTGSSRGREVQPGRMAVILGALRTAGRLAWADQADLDALATLPTRISAEHTTKVVRIDLAASAYFAVGLPPGASSIVSANGDGLEITTRLPGVAADAQGPRALDADAKQELVTAIEAAVGIAVTPEGSQRFLAMDLQPVVRHGAIWIRLSGEDCRALFDVEQWNAHKARNQKTDAPSVATRGGAEPTASAELRPDEREWLDRWCAAHLFKSASAAPTVTMYQLARRIDASGDARDAILDRLCAELAADKPVDAAALERALYEGQVDAARITAGLDPLVSGSRDAAPLYKVPLPARIVPHATEILDGDSVALELAVDWPAEHLSLLDQLARQRTNPFQVEVDWVIARLDGSDRVVAHAKGATEALTRSQRFKLQAAETRGTWTVQAFVRSTYFYPAAVATQIEVLTEAARLAELRAEAMGDLGGDAVTQAAHDFDIGVVDDSVSPDHDDHGVRLAGELPAGYMAPTDAERAENRARERETQTQLLAYLEQNAPEATDAIDAVKRSLARMDVVEKTLASDVTGGWRSFQVRGTYLSRDADVPSGPLDLYGTVEYQTHVELNPSEQREQTPPKVVSGVAVRLRDLSRRFENAAPIYSGFAPTFEAAFEAAFVDLCKAYPDGKISVLAEELDPDGSGRTGKTVGFELGTSSRLERVKEAVWDPAVNLIVNAAAVALMAFAPFATPIAFALLAANNTLRTVDELRTLSERGLLTDHKLEMSMTSIAFDILPFARYAKVVRSNDWIRYAIEGADHGGQVALMTHEVRDLAIQLQEQDVMALAEMYRGLTELERTSHPNDPRLKQRRDEIEERAREVGTRGYDAFSQVAGTRGLFMVASHQFQKLSAAAADATGAGQGKRIEVGVDDVAPGPRVIVAGTDAELRQRLLITKVEPGMLDVVVHGGIDDFYVHTASGIESFDHRRLATEVNRKGGKYERVRLVACESGKHPKGIAQQLANKLGVPVLAPTDNVYIDDDGFMYVGPNQHTVAAQQWVEFTPKPASRRFTPAKDRPEPTVRERLDARKEREQDETATKRLGPDVAPVRADEVEVLAELAQIPVATGKSKHASVGYRVTRADGVRIAELFRKLEGADVIEYRAGILVRRNGKEWYFELDERAGSTASAASRSDDGLPAPNVGTVELIAYSGVRKINGRPESQWTDAERAEVEEWRQRDPLIVAGHVGISFDGGKTIYGMTPKTDGLPLDDVIAALKRNEIFPGNVKVDNAHFELATERARDHGWDTEVTRAVIAFDPEEQAAIEADVLDRHDETLAGHPRQGYTWPFKTPINGEYYQGGVATDGRDFDATCVGNCAIFPAMVGVPIPSRGRMQEYMEGMKNWEAADAPIIGHREEPE